MQNQPKQTEATHTPGPIDFCAIHNCRIINGRCESEPPKKLSPLETELLTALQNFMHGVDTGAIKSDHDEVFYDAIMKARKALSKAKGA